MTSRLVPILLVAILAVQIAILVRTHPAPEQPQIIVKPSVPSVMWANHVLGYSTQYSEDAWSARQALGMPNVFPEHGDIQRAWASKDPDAHMEWIELGYAQPRAVRAVEIYETFNPGAIESIELITVSGRRIVLRGAPGTIDGRMGASQKRTFDTQCTSEPIAGVRVNIASQIVEGWNEIDAVGLVPCNAQ
jgi:hypothetical protein